MDERESLAAKRMRMLRLAAGMTAEELRQECVKLGVTTLGRGTIAKIETDKRKLSHATEIEAVARVFGLTSADLLDPDGPTVILSYAPQDDDVGEEVSGWLAENGFRVRRPDRAGRSGQADTDRRGLPAAADEARAFVALLSPDFLASPECLAELDLAARHQQRIEPASYVHVLVVAGGAELGGFGLDAYQPIDLASVSEAKKRKDALSKLGGKILRGVGTNAPASPGSQGTPAQAWDAFLDRRAELALVQGGLDSPAGPHFWLVMSPPGLGKTWLLRQLAKWVQERTDRQWIAKTVDLRASAADRPGDAMAVVADFFDIEPSGEPEHDLRAAARTIIRSGRHYLCLLDSAELMRPGTVADLRRYFGQIYAFMRDRGDQPGLALVAASRQDDRWRGVIPAPRVAMLPLAEFGPDSVQEALGALAPEINLPRSPAELRGDAEIVHAATEGVPALVRSGLAWIHAEDGLQIERLNHPDVFDEIVRPFIREQLLARDSLLPGDTSQSEMAEKPLLLMKQAITWLVPYRFFTLAHLRSLCDDDSFAAALATTGWSVNDLWQAIGRCALLLRPLDEPWQEIHPAIRRLLFRYFYPETERPDAHRRACEFTDQWSAKQNGREQVIGLIDCIWHEAARQRLIDVREMRAVLTRSAVERVDAIAASEAFTVTELRAYASMRIRGDEELRSEVVRPDGRLDERLFDDLVQIVEGTSEHGGEA